MGTIPMLYGPLVVWLNETPATASSVQPDPDLVDLATLTPAWFKLGENQNLGYSADGVQIEAAESLTDIFTDGVTMAVDTRRNEESVLLTATLMEDSLDLSSIAMAFNHNTVTVVPASPTVQGLARLTCTKAHTSGNSNLSAGQCLTRIRAHSSPYNSGYRLYDSAAAYRRRSSRLIR